MSKPQTAKFKTPSFLCQDLFSNFLILVFLDLETGETAAFRVA
jgi:hypothetical protein